MARKKTILLEFEEIDETHEYSWEFKREEKIVEEIIEDYASDVRSLAIVDYMDNNLCYRFNEEYIDIPDSEYNMDKNNLIIPMGEFNPLDYDTLYDFVNTSSGNYQRNYNWGHNEYADENIEGLIMHKIYDLFEEKKEELIEKLMLLKSEDLIESLDITKIVKNVRFETRKHKKTEEITRNKIERIFDRIKLEEIPEDMDLRKLSEEIVYEYKDMQLGDYLCDTDNSDFQDIYLRGCALLGRKDSYYKNIEFTGTKKEKFIFDILLESVETNTFTYSGGGQNYNQNGYRFQGFNNGYYVWNTRSNIHNAINCTLDLVLKSKARQNLKSQLEILSAMYVYLDNDKHSLEELKTIFEYKYLKNALLVSGLEAATGHLHKSAKIQESIKENLPKEPKDYYPMARKMKRKFILHIGPTNSGKTHDSLQKLKDADSGVYLAPLRLLALEVQERLVGEGLNCSLLTGEEEDILEGANHICSTVEKLNFSKRYDIAVIDECQMLEDRQRGSAWTAAILGVQAEEVHLCFASYATDVIINMIDYCGDNYEIVNHQRQTELIVSNEKYNFTKDIQKGDALVTFSKRKVLNLAATITAKTNMKCSVLFGALPYMSRKKQFQDFIDGKTDVLITTDAIGLGVNLAIKRIIFMESSKYDGQELRPLKTSEILQIGGRAGRRNIYDQGYIIAKNKEMLENYNKTISPIEDINVGLTEHLLEADGELEDIIVAWEQLDLSKPFKKANISNQFQILRCIEGISLRKKDRYKALFLPVNIKSRYETELLKEYLNKMASNAGVIAFPIKPEIRYGDELRQLEDYSKAIDLYYSFCKVYNMELDIEKVEREREATSSSINNLLISKNLEVPTCNTCGKKLSWDYGRYKCSDCYNEYNYGYGDFW